MTVETTPQDDDFTDDRPSKTQIKRQMHALVDLGKDLIELPDSQLRQLPLPDALYDAIKLSQRASNREPLLRTTHHLAQRMHEVYPDDTRPRLDIWKIGPRAGTTALQRSGALRHRLLEDVESLTEMLRDL